MDIKVDFFIIGSQKAGTTSLYNYMAQHPNIYLPEVKENHFFVEDRMYEQGVDYFHKFYQSYKNESAIGGAYVHMLPSPQTPERVKQYNPDAKILIMLRNPIDRAYSAYNFAIKNGWENEKTPFMSTIDLEEKRMKGNYTEKLELAYFHNGLYGKHLAEWLKAFPKEQIKVFFDDELREKRAATVDEAFNFVGVKTNVEIELDKSHNKSGRARFKSLHFMMRNKDSIIRTIGRNFLPFQARQVLRTKVKGFVDKFNTVEVSYPKLTADERAKLYQLFEKDIALLSSLIGRDVDAKWNPHKQADKAKK